MGNNTILQRFLCSLGNHLILPVVCQFFLVLENFMPRKGCSFRELSALAAGGSALTAVPGWHRGIPGCALVFLQQSRQIFTPVDLPQPPAPPHPLGQMLQGCV